MLAACSMLDNWVYFLEEIKRCLNSLGSWQICTDSEDSGGITKTIWEREGRAIWPWNWNRYEG
jgi:hypothetical protein